MKQAVVALIFNEVNGILAVSRKDDPNAFGLPGGKVDPGETLPEAIVREVEEETGLIVTQFCEIFKIKVDDQFEGTTYLCKVAGEINTTESGKVKWVGWPELINGPFGEYNQKLRDSLLSKFLYAF